MNLRVTRFLKRPTVATLVWLPLFIIVALPLVYIPEMPHATEYVRSLIFPISGMMLLTIPRTRERIVGSIKNFPRATIWGFAIFYILIILSFLFSSASFTEQFFGAVPYHIGLIHWLMILPVAVYCSRELPELLMKNSTLIVVLVVSLVSIFVDFIMVTDGLRLTGLFSQSTAMGMYGVIAMVLGLWSMEARQKFSWLSTLLIAVGSLVVLLAQTRIGLFAMFLGLAFAVIRSRKKIAVRVLSTVVIVSISAILLMPGVFSRFRLESVYSGADYRMQIYATSLHEMIDKHKIFGSGPSVLPSYLNDIEIAPDDIAATINDGWRFASSHNLWLDIGLQFGMVALLLFIFFQFGWITRRIDFTHTTNAWYVFLWSLIAIYTLVDVVNIVITPMYIILTSGLYFLKALEQDD